MFSSACLPRPSILLRVCLNRGRAIATLFTAAGWLCVRADAGIGDWLGYSIKEEKPDGTQPLWNRGGAAKGDMRPLLPGGN